MPKKKKRAPIEQLRDFSKIARQMLVDKKIIHKDSMLDKILHDKDAPVLPGQPGLNYLPHKYTIQAAQRMMYDLIIIWKDECKDNGRRAESITEFFKFLVKELRKQETEINKEINNLPKLMRSMKNVPVIKDVFSPMQKKDTLKAMHRFFIDSFAVAIMLKKNDISNYNTSEYLNWFLDWSQQLYALWVKPDDREKMPKV